RGVERFPCTGEAGLQAVLPARPVYADGMGWTRADRVGVARGDPGLAGDGVSVRRRDVATNPVHHRVLHLGKRVTLPSDRLERVTGALNHDEFRGLLQLRDRGPQSREVAERVAI